MASTYCLIFCTTTTTGTGAYTYGAAVTNYRSFSVLSDGTQVPYMCRDASGNFERGLGTKTTTTLSRDTIYESSNAGAAVNWGAGTRDLYVHDEAENALTKADNLASVTSAPTALRNLGVLPSSQTGGTNGKVVRLSSANTWTDASNADTADQLRGLAFKVGGEYYPPGSVITGLTLTAATTYYLSTAGAITSTAPTHSSTVRQVVVGRSISTTALWFDPQPPQTGTGSHLSLAAGTTMVFWQAAAPTGWTKSTAHNDKALRVVSGTGGGSGGTELMSSAFTGGFTLLETHIPAHTHTIAYSATSKEGGGMNYIVDGIGSGASSTATGSTGGGSSHDHTVRLAYIDVIVCALD